MSPHTARITSPRLDRYAAALALSWTLVVAALLLWNFLQQRQATRDVAFGEARRLFEKDQALRQWAFAHGPVYVPADSMTDAVSLGSRSGVETPGGRLMAITPAAMVRQLNKAFPDVPTRLTSQSPVSPFNRPDRWEQAALSAFERGVREVSEFTEIAGAPYLRLMRPLTAEKGCLRCHRDPDLRIGQVMGAAGVAVPMNDLLAREHRELLKQFAAHGVLWMVGLVGLTAGYRRVALQERERRRAETQLRNSEARKSAVFEAALDCIVTTDEHGRIIEFNPAAEATFGYSRHQAVGRDVAELLVAPDQRPAFRRRLARIVQGRKVRAMQRRIETLAQRVDGSLIPVELAVTRIDLPGQTLFTAYLRDISERKASEVALRESEERYALAARGANDGLWDWDLRTGHIHFSQRWKAMVGAEEWEIGTGLQEWFDRVHREDIGKLRLEIDAHIEGLTPQLSNEHRIWHKDGIYRWFLARALVVRDPDGQPYRLAGSLTDITERRLAEEQLLHDAFHDALTGLSNRALFMDQLDRVIERARRRPDFRFAVLFLDLDRFKLINDGLGHLVGDQLLLETARRLSESVRPGDAVARLGGDEFTILLEDVADVKEVEALAGRLQKAVSRPLVLGEREICMTTSIGIVLSDGRYERCEDLLRDADIAMYRAKWLGKGQHVVFDASMHAQALAQLNMESDLRKALDNHEFWIAYQPIVSLPDHRIVGFEALLRWQHPERGVIPPLDFIPLAEETGLILPLGRWVLGEACRQLKAWQKSFGDGLWVSVNVSGKQVMADDLVGQVAALFEQTGLSASALKLEMTESVLIDGSANVIAVVDGLEALGVDLCIDDFGIGYSAMSYLHRFPVSTLKIDRSFVARIEGEGLETIRAIIALANNLGLSIVAEGVETAAQLARLEELDCHYVQGYYFSKPLPATDVQALLGSDRAETA